MQMPTLLPLAALLCGVARGGIAPPLVLSQALSMLTSPLPFARPALPSSLHTSRGRASVMSSIEACEQRRLSEEEHCVEIQKGWEVFGRVETHPTPRRTFSDEDFITRAVPAGFAGPDEGLLRKGCNLHASTNPLISAAECAAVIAEAQSAMSSGQTSTFTYTKANRISEVHVSQLPNAREWLSQRLADTFWPLLESRFGKRDGSATGSVVSSPELAVYDALVIKYDASRGGVRQPIHRDAALISMNIALNSAEEYSGGGTYFEPLSETLTLEQGQCLCHASGIRHAGHPILSGERWVLVIFALSRGAVQHARRCADRGVKARREGQLEQAKAAMTAGVEEAPRDHELRHGLAMVHAMEGSSQLARSSLRTASNLYPFCPKPHNGLGAMLLADSRPRAALREYERALALSLEPDDDDGWDATVNSALCLITLAERECVKLSLPAQSGELLARWRDPMSLARLRVWEALVSLPSERRLHALLSRSEVIAPTELHELPQIRKVINRAMERQRRRLGAAILRSWDGSASSSGSSHVGGALVIAFAGADAALGGGVRNGVPSHEFVRACRRAGVERALFVRDVLRAWYLRGIGPPRDFSVDKQISEEEACTHGSFEGMVEMLRREIELLQPERVVTIGSSMGGYAAVRAGIALGADRIVAFAPQVVIDPAAREAHGLGNTPFSPFLEGLKAFSEVEGFEMLGLAEAVAKGCRGTQIELHVGAEDENDVAEALILQRAVERAHTSEAASGHEGGEATAGREGIGSWESGEKSHPGSRVAEIVAKGPRCDVIVHPGRDHNMVVDMRDSGELHTLLCSLQDTAGRKSRPEVSLPEGFVGFHDCPDF